MCEMAVKAGYHLSEITKGEYGELSKIYEEFQECRDAWDQGNPLMVLLELSDIVGAILGYVAKYLPGTDIEDIYPVSQQTEFAYITSASLFKTFQELSQCSRMLQRIAVFKNTCYLIDCYMRRFNMTFADVLRMSEATQRAFQSGARK